MVEAGPQPHWVSLSIEKKGGKYYAALIDQHGNQYDNYYSSAKQNIYRALINEYGEDNLEFYSNSNAINSFPGTCGVVTTEVNSQLMQAENAYIKAQTLDHISNTTILQRHQSHQQTYTDFLNPTPTITSPSTQSLQQTIDQPSKSTQTRTYRPFDSSSQFARIKEKYHAQYKGEVMRHKNVILDMVQQFKSIGDTDGYARYDIKNLNPIGKHAAITAFKELVKSNPEVGKIIKLQVEAPQEQETPTVSMSR